MPPECRNNYERLNRERELEIQHVHVSLLTTATGQRILEFIVWIFGLVFPFSQLREKRIAEDGEEPSF